MKPREWSRWLSRRPPVLILALPLVYAAVILAVGWVTGKWSETIYFLTGLILIWYTVETHAMRKETTRHNELLVEPLVVVTRIQQDPYGLVLRNIGRGAALYVAVEDVQIIIDGGKEPEFVAKFSTADIIEASGEAFASVDLLKERGGESKRVFSFVSNLDPKYQQKHDIPVIIAYQDVNGGRHRTELSMGKSGTKLVRHE